MKVYSAIEESKSVMKKNNYKIKIPASKGWYPFVITFNPTSFGTWSKTNAEMSIMYNFAKFDFETLSSGIFDSESQKQSSFYGAYALTQETGYFGYENNKINLDEIALTFKYDYRLLVLSDLGCMHPVFEIVESHIEENVSYLNFDGWTRIDAVMNTNSMLHTYKENHTSYIQYGKPSSPNDDFPIIDMYGRLYIRLFEEYNSTVIVYVMSPYKETIDQCDKEILQYVRIKPIG